MRDNFTVRELPSGKNEVRKVLDRIKAVFSGYFLPNKRPGFLANLGLLSLV